MQLTLSHAGQFICEETCAVLQTLLYTSEASNNDYDGNCRASKKAVFPINILMARRKFGISACQICLSGTCLSPSPCQFYTRSHPNRVIHSSIMLNAKFVPQIAFLFQHVLISRFCQQTERNAEHALKRAIHSSVVGLTCESTFYCYIPKQQSFKQVT